MHSHSLHQKSVFGEGLQVKILTIRSNFDQLPKVYTSLKKLCLNFPKAFFHCFKSFFKKFPRMILISLILTIVLKYKW